MLPLAVLLFGPTGSGKTALSLSLGKRFGGEVVSCDSVAVYRGMDLGSAKPTREQQALLPHHLIDVTDPDRPFTAGEYSRQARAAMRQIAQRGRIPLITGGTGLYLRALADGLTPIPTRHDGIRAHLSRSNLRHGQGFLHRMLHRLDPASSARIHANDTPKLIRALEIIFSSGQKLSFVQATPRDPLTGFRLLRIGLNPPRATLYDRLNRRASAMFSAGLIEETRALQGRFGRVQALDAIGYRQACTVLAGSMSELEAIAAAQQGHRNYAKRQLTWFRREADVHWIESFGDERAALAVAEELVIARI